MQSDESGPDDDLRTRLHAMETRLRRMRDQRATHNESARRAADSRNSVQEQGRELRSSIEEKLTEQKEVRSRAKTHQNQRDAIQSRIREIISNKRGKKGDEGKAKTGVVALSETIAKIGSIENRLMTDGTLTLKAENRILRELKTLIARRDELLPAAAEFESIKIDLGDLESTIQSLKAEADAQHKAMTDAHKEADGIWEEVKPMLEERDFLRSEGDRLHSIFVESRESANSVHSEIEVLLKEVNEARDEMKARREERERVIKDHNQSVKDALKTPDEDEGLADSLTEKLLSQGNLTLGGSMSGDAQGSPAATGGKPSRKKIRKPKSFRGRGK
ncbi:MAG: hypothetical protein QGI73_04465 [Candidatus Thalassarchaeaceae archaeon]|jgi:uncharacterized coiled-coil DUF342 family protein|nr:hypothetical protein [Euryarchaeota archaeon]MDP6871467.1 hypothetical protein [Candidatus Thalassarchaeaceae archaeon]|tara:strand:+ start:11189 stop:12187 length:999 start_codon:yes stop_codon:yes gene_type:complete